MEGGHTIERSHEVTEAAQEALFHALYEQRCEYPGLLLKPNMVLSGYDAKKQASVAEVAQHSIECFRVTVPAAVPGIVFLSGGQSDEQATSRLNEMNKLGPHPWNCLLVRPLQAPALEGMEGRPGERAGGASARSPTGRSSNGAARSGSYTEAMEKAA